MARYRLKTSFIPKQNDSQGIRGPLVSPTSSPSRHQPRLLEEGTHHRVLNAAHRPFPVPAAASQGKSKHEGQLTATSAEPGSVCGARTEVGSKERLHQLLPGTLGSRELRRQTQARQTEARAAPADWSEIRPISAQGRCRRPYAGSPRLAGAPANQCPAPEDV